MYDLQDRQEQNTRKNLLEFHGIPESAYLRTIINDINDSLFVYVCVFASYFHKLLLFYWYAIAQFASKFDVFSLNVRGIRDLIKRRSIFSFLKDQKASIYIYFFTRNILGTKTSGKKNGVTSYFLA